MTPLEAGDGEREGGSILISVVPPPLSCCHALEPQVAVCDLAEEQPAGSAQRGHCAALPGALPEPSPPVWLRKPPGSLLLPELPVRGETPAGAHRCKRQPARGKPLPRSGAGISPPLPRSPSPAAGRATKLTQVIDTLQEDIIPLSATDATDVIVT